MSGPSQRNSSRRRGHRAAERLRDALRNLRPGEKLEPMNVLAARFSVSVNTLRIAMAQLESEGWLEIRHGSGCYVRRTTPAPPARHVAVLTEYNVLLSTSRADFYRHLMNELRMFLQAKGRSSRLYIGHLTSERPDTETLTCAEFMDDLALDRIEGIIALAALPLYHWTHEAHARRIPIVGMRGCSDRFDVSVDPDLEGGVRDALSLAARHQRRRPAFAGWGPDIEEAFLSAVAEFQLEARPEWVRATLHPAHAGAGWSEVREIWSAAEIKPDAIIFGDDVLFEDAVPALASLGVRIPEDLLVVVLGNAGIPLKAPFPFLRLDCELREMASVMASQLIALMSGSAVSGREVRIPYRCKTGSEVCSEENPERKQDVVISVAGKRP